MGGSTSKPSQQELPVTNPADLPRQRVRSISLRFDPSAGRSRLQTQSGPPDDNGGDHDGDGKVGCELVVSCGDASPILEAADHALDEIALAIGSLVERMMSLAGRIVRDDRNCAAFEKKATQTIAVVGRVGSQAPACRNAAD